MVYPHPILNHYYHFIDEEIKVQRDCHLQSHTVEELGLEPNLSFLSFMNPYEEK